jgi:hypothetical protein
MYKQNYICRIWGSHNSGYEEFHLGSNAMKSVENQLTSGRNMLAGFISGVEVWANWETSRKQAAGIDMLAVCFMVISCLAFNPEDIGSMLLPDIDWLHQTTQNYITECRAVTCVSLKSNLSDFVQKSYRSTSPRRSNSSEQNLRVFLGFFQSISLQV